MGHQGKLSRLSLVGVIVSLGIIYGDIGTSPLYVMKAVLLATQTVDESFILGALSCIIWTLTLQTTIKYVIITLKADNRGEGGIFSLFALLRRKRRRLFFVAIIGGSALLADGVITPSITVMSAIEALNILDPRIPVIPVVIAILAVLFFVQQFGTSAIGKSFGPIMFGWFTMLAVLGVVNLLAFPSVLKAFNPYYAWNVLVSHPGGFILLGAVFLCTTGAEALYTDLGHCGIRNIRVSWTFVKTALVLNYLGQGAWVLSHLDSLGNANPFFAMMPHWFLPMGIAMATAAAIIASQALISGSFTLISEAMSLNFWPKIRLKYPSTAKGQMYVPAINWMLFVSCCVVVLLFQHSANMEAAYGLSITITMLMTTVLMISYLALRRVKVVWIVLFSMVFFAIEGVFFVSNATKFMHGGWFTVLMASGLSFIMFMMYGGRRVRNRFITFDKIDPYLPVLCDLSGDESVPKYAGNLVYTTHADNRTDIESKAVYSIISRQPKRADMYWFLHVDILDNPSTLQYKVTPLVEGKVMRIDFYLGFKVQPRINEYFKQVLTHLADEGRFDNISRHPSLRKHGILNDFRFVQIDRQTIRHVDLPFWDKLSLNMYFWLRRLGITDMNAYELDSSLVTIERIPLTIPCRSKIPTIEMVK
ncbi:MAG: KUP/HAK/KT family potassium transporter [Marinilabiliaceae bacterium]|nr:KUP/HAK/KT family potassium transporter [Marinilabiliaceae bacterium]